MQYMCGLFTNILPPTIAYYSRSLLYTMGKRLALTCFIDDFRNVASSSDSSHSVLCTQGSAQTHVHAYRGYRHCCSRYQLTDCSVTHLFRTIE